MLPLQTRSVLLAFKVVTIGTVILRFVGARRSCWDWVVTGLGEIPLQLVGAAVAWQFCYLYMPKNGASDPVLQVCGGADTGVSGSGCVHVCAPMHLQVACAPCSSNGSTLTSSQPR